MKKNKIITTGMKTMRYYLQSFIVVLLFVCYSNVSKSQNGVNGFTIKDPCTNCIGTAQNALYSFPVVLSFNWTNNTTSATATLGYDNAKVSYDNFNLSSLPSCISVNYATPGVLTVKMLNLSSCPSPTGAISFQVYFRFICRDSCANDIITAYFKGTLTDNFNNALTSNCSIDGKYISNWIFNHTWYSYNASTAEITYKVDFTNQSCVIVKNPKFNVTLSPCSGTITHAWGTEDSNNDGIPDYTYTVSGGTTITPNSSAYMLYAHDIMYYVVKLNCGTCINQTLISNIKLMGDNCNIPNSTIVTATPPVGFPIPSPAANPSATLVKSVSTYPSPHFVSVITNTGNTSLNLIMDDFLPLVHASSVIQRSNQIGLNNTANYYDCSGTIGTPNILITASGNNGTPALTNLPVNTKKIKYSINNLLPNSWVKLEVYFDLTSSCSAGTPPYKDSCSVSYNCTAPAVTCMPCGTGTGTKTGVVVYNPQPILSCISHSNYNSSCKKVGDTLNFCFTFKNTGDAPMPAGGIFYAPMPNWLQRIPNSETFTGFTSNPTYLSGNAKWTLPSIAIGSTVSLCFNTIINAGATGQAIVTPTVFVGNKNYDIIGSGDCQIIINICAFAAIGIDKKVKGSLDSSYGLSGSGVAGSLVNYEITLHNTGSGAVDHLEVIDRIPSSGDLTILGNPNSTSRGSQFNLLMGSPLPIIPNCTVSYSSVPNACTGWAGVGLNCGLPLLPVWSPTSGGAKNIHFLFNPSVTMAPGDIKTFNFQLQIPAGTPTGLLACNSAGFIAKPVNAAFTINPVESPIVCVEVKPGGVQPQQGCCNDVMKKIQANQNVENNTLVVNANMSVGPSKIKSASVSLIDFHVMHPKECDVCVKDPKLMGNIVNPSGAGSWDYVPQGVSYSHSIEWKDNIGKDWSNGIPLHFEIPLPPKNPDSNCCDTISYCLKYSFTDTACITCDTIICYQVINGKCGGGGSTGCSCNFKPVFNYSLDGYRIGRDGRKYFIHGVAKSSNVTCGDVLNLSAGSFSTTVTPNFECKDKSGKNCRGAVLNVTIKKPDNIVQILAGTLYSYSFASPGTYEYTISAVCDGKKCECTFKVVIGGGNTSCKCNKWSGEPVKYQGTANPTSPAIQGTVKCDSTIVLSKGTYTFTAPAYFCSPDTCHTNFTWILGSGGNKLKIGRGDTFSYNFISTGTYTLSLTPRCGGSSCPPCTFTVIIRDVASTCSCSFNPFFEYKVNNGKGLYKNPVCGDVINLPFGNYSAVIVPNFQCKDKSGKDCNGGDLNITITKQGSAVQSLTGPDYSYTFALPGTYLYTLSAVCNGKKCECTFTVVIAANTALCNCGSWSGNPIQYQSAATPTSSAKQGTINCNDSITLPIGIYTFTAPDYNCSSGSCLSYNWIFRSPNNFQGVQRVINALHLDFNNGYFGGLGTYKIYIYAKCGSKDCGTCSFKVTIVNKRDTPGNGTGTQALSPTFANPTTSLKPTFTWTNASNAKDLFYRILLAKLEPEQFQNPESGLKNKAIVDKAGISNTSFAYPANAPQLEKGQVYVWGVQAYKKGTELNSSELPTVVGVFVPDPPSPPEAMPCSDCPFGCDGACIRDGSVLSGCWCLPYLHPDHNKIAVKVESDTLKEVAFSWETDYQVENKDILGYLRTKELTIKKGVYKFNYSTNIHGDVTLLLAIPIRDNRIEKKQIMFEGIPANNRCDNDGSSCIGGPPSTMKENPSFYIVKPVVENALITKITLSYRGTKVPLPNAKDTIPLCTLCNGRGECSTNKKLTCGEVYYPTNSTWTCVETVAFRGPIGNIRLNRLTEGRASITIDSKTTPITSDAVVSFLLNQKQRRTTGKTDDEKSQKEFETFMQKDKGVVSDNSLQEISKELGVPITEGGGTGTDNSNQNGKEKSLTNTHGITINCRIASHKTDCFDGGGLCDCKISLIALLNPNDGSRLRNMNVNVIGNNMFIHFAEPLPSGASVFVFDEPTILDNSIATELGFKNITIQPGSYKVEKEDKGTLVKLKVVTNKDSGSLNGDNIGTHTQK